jgi:hypothetical protein
VNYTETDYPISEGGTGDRCGEINQAAINWAMQVVSPKTLQRYQEYGQKMLVTKINKLHTHTHTHLYMFRVINVFLYFRSHMTLYFRARSVSISLSLLPKHLAA